MFLVASLLCLAVETLGQGIPMKLVENRFKYHKLVPNVIFYAPKYYMKVSFNGHKVHLGTELKPDDCKEPPQVNWNWKPGGFYTLAMTDPDYPVTPDTEDPKKGKPPPTVTEYRHWLVVNIMKDDPATGETLTPYEPPAPQNGTYIHRYMILVYKQSGRLGFKGEKEKGKGWSRGKWVMRKFAKKHDMKNPTFGNYFLAQHHPIPPKPDYEW
uniref:OV-16 antigen n=1 Tax=Cacopsylla melanoneura TaxID=428564 RepID=A0A8D8T1M3_9HEMI